LARRARAFLPLAGAVALAMACAEYVVAPQERAVRGLQLDDTLYTVDEGQRVNVVATALDQFGAPFTTLPPGVAIAWTTSDSTVAKVDTAGTLAGVAAGAAQVTATVRGDFGSFTVSAKITVRPLVSAIAEAAGDSQTGVVGQALASRLAVRVTNRLGAGVPRIAVTFAVVGAGGSLDTASTTTDSTGLATAGWTLGTVVGTDTVQARTPRLPAAVVTFTAQAAPGLVSALVKVSGDSQAAGRGALLAAPLVVRAVDRFANPVPGVAVAWAVATGGGSIAPPSSITGAQGTAAAQWTLGAAAGAQTATASVGGAISATFTATATVPVVSVTVTPGTPALASGATQQLTATPKDSAGNPVAGRTATWTTSDSTVARVSATGLVTAAKVGVATITATVDTAKGTATVTVTPGAASTATSLVSVSAPTVLVGGAVTFTLATRDAAGNALTAGGSTVTFTTSGGTSAGTTGAVTDKANGTYTAGFTGTAAGTALTVGATIGGQAVTTTLPTVQVLADTVVASVTVAPASDTIASGATVQLAATPKNAAGTALTGKTVTWATGDSTIAKVSAAGLVTAVKVGTASITATVQGVVGTASITVKPGAPSLATSFVTVTPAAVNVGGTVTLKLTTRDAAGNTLITGGHVVTFTQSGGTSAGTVGAVTDSANGSYVATFTATVAGTPVAIGATIDGQPIVPAGPPPTITVNAASTNLVHWIAASGSWSTAANWNPARVPTLLDTAVVDAVGTYTVLSAGDSVGGLVVGPATASAASVQFSAASKVRGNVEVRASGILDVAAAVIVGNFRNDGQTDVEKGSVLAVDTTGGGTAQNFGVMTLADSSAVNVSRTAGLVNHGVINPGATPGSEASNLAVVTVAGNLTLGTGSAVYIDISGPNFRDYDVVGVTGNATLGDTLRVQLLGGFVPAAGQTFMVMTWTSFSGTFATVILPAIGGQWQVSYTPFGLMLSVTAGPAARVSASQGDGLTAPAGSAVPIPPGVQVTDAGDNPIVGASVTFAVTSGGGSVIAPATVTTDASGVAIVGGWQLGPTPGTNTMTATVAGSGIAGNPVTFTVTGTTPTATWTGALSTDWSNPGNWSPAAVPAATGDVFIGPAANQPVLTAASFGRTVTIQGSGALLTIGGQTLSASTLNVESGGLLVMTNSADVVSVSGNADFTGGNETGGLTAGQLRLAGNFNAGVNTSNASFATSGTFRVVLTGTTLQQATFVDLTGASHFQDLDISASAGINIQFDFNGLAVKGTFTSQPTGAATPMLYGLGRSLTAARLQISRLVVDDAPLILNEGVTISSHQIDSITFQNFRGTNGTATTRQLTIVMFGGNPTARTQTVNNPVFVPLGTGDTGSYVGAAAIGGAGSLIVNIVGANVANGPAFTTLGTGATVNWQ
jgi:uncharacterized protein YjdB